MNAPERALAWLRWLCLELVDGLLRPVWLRYRAERDAGRVDTAARAFQRFCGLVNAAPCWPCRIEFSPDGPLWITDADFDCYSGEDLIDL